MSERDLARLEAEVHLIRTDIAEVSRDLNKFALDSAVDRTKLRSDIEAIKTDLENHLSTHRRYLVYIGLIATILSAVVDMVLKVIWRV